MKIKLLLLASLILVSFSGLAQNQTYYNYKWQKCSENEACFVSKIEMVDSGWMRYDYYINNMTLQMKGLYKDEACTKENGTFYYFYPDGALSKVQRLINGIHEGPILKYYKNGMIMDSALYQSGKLIGDHLSWHINGNMEDSIHKVNDSTFVEVSWFENGNPAAAGVLVNRKMQGRWQFFHQNGKLSSIELYQSGIVKEFQLYNENGEEQSDTSNYFREAAFKDGKRDFVDFIYRNTYWPNGYQFGEIGQATVVVRFVVNEMGEVENVELEVPFHPIFDKIAINAINASSKKWIPARAHNRNVKSYYRQAVNFVQK